MQKWLKHLGVAGGLSLSLLSQTMAQPGPGLSGMDGTEINSSVKGLKSDFENFGKYLGYDVTNSPSDKINTNLINASLIMISQISAIKLSMGAMPVTAVNKTLELFVPSNNQFLNSLNTYANMVYNQSNEDSNQKSFINPLVDQQTYQNDPVSQAVVNILTTPDFSFCIKNVGSVLKDSCQKNPRYGGAIAENAIGTIPSTQDFFSFESISSYIPALNSNTLLAPLSYNTSSIQTNETSSSQPTQPKGLAGSNQEETAANFIKYVTSATLPIDLASEAEYSNLHQKATSSISASNTAVDINNAKIALASYLSSLRVFAAKASVSISNIYYIFGRRLAQSSDGMTPPTSQAAIEYRMATWRLFDPANKGDQWVTKISTSSPATVQKEMAILLSEINYQMYLNREQQERLLLTNSVLLLTSLYSNPPKITNFTNK